MISMYIRLIMRCEGLAKPVAEDESDVAAVLADGDSVMMIWEQIKFQLKTIKVCN